MPQSQMPKAFQCYVPPERQVYGAICVNPQGEVLLVRGRKGQKWSFPKGHRHGREEEPIDCARRELMEETGLTAPTNFVSSHKLQGGTYYIFAIEGDAPELRVRDLREIDAIAWWPLTSLPEKDTNIDVSIFRTLMRAMNPAYDSSLTFIRSEHARKRVACIKRSIDDAAWKRNPPVELKP